MNVSKKLILIAVPAIVIGSSAYAYIYLSKQDQVISEKISGAFKTFVVERGRIQKTLEIDDAKVTAQRELNLGFPLSGIVEKVFFKEGDRVGTATPLMKLDTTELELELKSLAALKAQRRAALDKLMAGATEEDIRVVETKVRNAAIALEDARQSLVDKVKDAYTKSDDAVRTKLDGIFSSPQSSMPQLNFPVSDFEIENAVESGLPETYALLGAWHTSLAWFGPASNLPVYSGAAKANLTAISSYLDKVTFALARAILNVTVTQTTVDTWKTNISAARTNVNTAVANVSAAEEKLKTAESALALAGSELNYKTADARVEDVAAARADIDEVNSKIATVNDRMKKSTLLGPGGENIVNKIWFEEKEFYASPKPAVTLSSPGNEVEADISEDDIGEVGVGSKALIQIEALPGEVFRGEVSFIEPGEIVKNIDEIFYRVKVTLPPGAEAARAGMSAKLEIETVAKEDVLFVPSAAVYKNGGKAFVKVRAGNAAEAREVKLGISNSEFTEVREGVKKGETILLPR